MSLLATVAMAPPESAIWARGVALSATQCAEITLLLGGETLAGIEAKALAVEHRVVDDRERQLRVLLGLAEPLGERGVLGERRGELIGNALGETGGEQARRDGQHPDAQAAEITRHGEAHARDGGLRRGV